MDFPGIALRTYQQMKNHPILSKYFFSILKRLSSINDQINRAKEFHDIIDDCVDSVFQNEIVNRSVSCKVGCSGCCHTPVSVTEDEAKLLANRIREENLINLKELERQSIVSDSSLSFYALSFEHRKCVFLNKKGACKVYEDRPAVCRTNFVVGDPKQCDTSDGKEKSVRLLNTTKADMAIIAGFQASGKSGLLPRMVMEQLGKSHSPLLVVRKDTFTKI